MLRGRTGALPGSRLEAEIDAWVERVPNAELLALTLDEVEEEVLRYLIRRTVEAWPTATGTEQPQATPPVAERQLRRTRDTVLDLAACLVAPQVAEEFFGLTEDYLDRKIGEGWGPWQVGTCLVTTIVLGIWHSFTGKLLSFRRRRPGGG